MLTGEQLNKMALADKPDYLSSWSDPQNPHQKVFDYTHFLPQDLVDSGYKMHVHEVKIPLSNEYIKIGMNAYVKHPSSKRESGIVGGYTYELKPNVEKRCNVAFTHAFEIDKGHRGLNLGKHALLALLTHGFKHDGIDTVQTFDGHTMNAEKAHRWLIAQENLGEGQDIPPTQIRGNDPDSIRGYRYTLKNEQPMSKSEGRGSMLTNGRYAVYHMIPKEDGVHKHLASVFALKNGGFHLLEDYADVFTKYHTQDGDTPSNLLEHRIRNLVNNSSYYKVIPTKEDNVRDPDNRHKMVTPEDINSGRQVFVYHSPHHNGPSQLVYDKGSFHLNGYPLSIAELKHIKESVEGGSSKISYPEDMFKAEGGMFEGLSKATLYHGTIVDHEPSIRQVGIVPQVGQFIRDMYGDDYDEMMNDPDSEQSEVAFWSDKKDIGKASNAIIHNIARKLGKGFHSVTKDDIRNHGLLAIAKDVEPESHKRFSSWGSGVYRAPDEGEGYEDWYPKPNPYIEPRDYFTTNNMVPHVILKGSKLVSFLERMRGQKKGTQHPSKLGKAEGMPFEPEDDFFDTDYMCPQIGNLHAYRKFVGGEPQGGSHIFLTSDSVKKVLEDDGVKSHNDILIAIANMLDKAASVPDESGRCFHVGHDSYYVWMPSYEAGLQFLYNLQALVNELPTIYSKHPYFEIGLSDELEEAFNALTQVGEYKEHDGQEGNHVMIHTGNTTRYVSPSDIL